MKKLFPILMVMLLLVGCSAPAESWSYRQINGSDAIAMMEEETDYIILDVRTAEEFKDNLGFILGIMKSLLNLADLRGIRTVYGSNPALYDLYKMLRFQKETMEDGKKRYALDLEGYFTADSCTHTE